MRFALPGSTATRAICAPTNSLHSVYLKIIEKRISLILLLCLTAATACAEESDAPGGNCLEITLTGTQGGPPAVNGQAGAGTLVRYGTAANHCSDVLLQFDAGRGTTVRLSQLGISPAQLDAIFLTHIHSDHTEGLAGALLLRWHFFGGPIDVVCSADVKASKPPPERIMSCSKLVTHTADAMIQSGEIAQRHAENKKRDLGGPATLVRLKQVALPLPKQPGHVVWQSGDVTVTAIGTTHIAGSLAYRVDTPAGNVVIGGDAGNGQPHDTRDHSTSASVEMLAKGADVVVHSTMHPVFAPGKGSKFPPLAFHRQSNTADLGAMAERAGVKHLMLTHLIPSLDSPSHGPFVIPGGPLDDSDFESAARDGGFTGKVYVGDDLTSLRLP